MKIALWAHKQWIKNRLFPLGPTGCSLGVRHKYLLGPKNHENFVKTQRKLNHFCRVFAGCAAVPGQWFSAKKSDYTLGSLQTPKFRVVFFRPPGARALPPEARTASMLRWRGRFHRNAPFSDLERANTYVQGCIFTIQSLAAG